MKELINIMTSIRSDRPAYRVLDPNGFFGPDDHLYIEGEEVYFDGEPNEQMEPLNDIAKAMLIRHIEKLETEARELAEKLGHRFHGRPRSLDGGLTLATELQRNGISIMGVRKDESKVIAKVHPDGIPETGSKRSAGRPPGAKNKPKLSVNG